jgi:hypothetical protein
MFIGLAGIREVIFHLYKVLETGIRKWILKCYIELAFLPRNEIILPKIVVKANPSRGGDAKSWIFQPDA